MLALLCFITLTPPIQKVPVVIPPIGRVLGHPIGYATVEDFIKKVGPPSRSIGGHPDGRCTWFDPVNMIVISMDGFEWARNGMLVDEIEITGCAGADGTKKVRRKLKLSDYKVCGGALAFGMTRAKSLQIVRKKGWKFSKHGDNVRLTAPGNVDFRGVCSNAYHVVYHWETTLYFSDDKLSAVKLRVDYKSSP